MIYHYTSIESFHKILKSAKCYFENNDRYWELFFYFRASTAFSMNDPTEARLVPNAFERVGIPIGKIFSASKFIGEEYVLSFSKKSDDLNMWRNYGDDGKGISMGFNSEVIKEVWKEYGITGKVSWIGDCEYTDEDEVSRWIKKRPLYAEYFNNTENLLPLIHLYGECMRFKHKSYVDESEFRVIVQEPFSEGSYVKNSRIVPFTELPIPLRALRTITIGPRADYEYTAYSISQVMRYKFDGYLNRYSNLEYPFLFQRSYVPYK